MGMCDPKAVRKGTPWYLAVNQPGFMSGNPQGKVAGTAPSPKSKRDNTLSKQQPKE